ncbi:helix-turn-helix domain-containing protein [Kribbella sp. VKM Ac-2566]|uniref:helix-turn-helix transcriptional regulator n=1 Tax=Kribbella sp. VKM Ac-2566 TaxID=2512218 RepID=UPI001062A8A6|nr:helix-turn-helix transcriptional regulator [Kribbella sp. VKM Ac-2566]TDX08852.1 AraC family transcriptional regulator [Kribbella sp. VKM Ac-2566]
MPEARQRPASTGHQPIQAGGGIDPHWHDRNQIVYAGRGVLSVTTDAGSWVAPGTRAIWIPAGTLHQHRAYGETTLHTVGLEENPLDLDAPSALVVSPLLRELILAYTDPAENQPDETQRLRAVLLDQLRRSPQRPTYLPTPRDARLAAACDVLREDPADARTLTELGRAVGASERTLSRLCKVELGMTFPQWRTQLRLHEALRLLAEGNSVTQVAHACGWASTSAFIDTFRRAFGHTPGSRRA